jgi:hypothetical protein
MRPKIFTIVKSMLMVAFITIIIILFICFIILIVTDPSSIYSEQAINLNPILNSSLNNFKNNTIKKIAKLVPNSITEQIINYADKNTIDKLVKKASPNIISQLCVDNAIKKEQNLTKVILPIPNSEFDSWDNKIKSESLCYKANTVQY